MVQTKNMDYSRFYFLTSMDYIVHGGQKIELAQKIHASRG